MGLFDRIRKKGEANAEPKVAPKKAAKASASKKTDAETVVATNVVNQKTAQASLVLVAPRVSEKAAALASRGTYVFNVPIAANKVEIRKAVEALYKVEVESVRTVRGIGKPVLRGRIAGRRPNWKKALVTLKSGQTLSLYEGV